MSKEEIIRAMQEEFLVLERLVCKLLEDLYKKKETQV